MSIKALTKIPKHRHVSVQSPEVGSKATPAAKIRQPGHVALHASMVGVCADVHETVSHDPHLRRMFADFAKLWPIMHLHPVDGYDRLNDLYHGIDDLVCRIIADALRRQGLRWISFEAHVVPPHSDKPAHITLTVWPRFRRNDRQVREHMEIPV